MKFYGLKNCDTCKKALKELEGLGMDVDYIDVRADGVPTENLENWLSELGADKIVNKRSTTWRNFSDVQKAAVEAGENLVSILLENPTLIKRPVIEANGTYYIGIKELNLSA